MPVIRSCGRMLQDLFQDSDTEAIRYTNLRACVLHF